MNFFFSVMLLVLGSASTLAAFGGDTWLKGSSPLLPRVTWRGWASLFCLTCALALGIAKEQYSAGESRKQDIKRGEEEKKLDAAYHDLAITKDHLAIANQTLATLNAHSARLLDDNAHLRGQVSRLIAPFDLAKISLWARVPSASELGQATLRALSERNVHRCDKASLVDSATSVERAAIARILAAVTPGYLILYPEHYTGKFFDLEKNLLFVAINLDNQTDWFSPSAPD